MNSTLTATRPLTDRQPLGFRALVVGSLLGFALLYLYVQVVLLGKVEMPLPIFVVVSLLLAALLAGRPVGGWRWTPLLGAAWSCSCSATSISCGTTSRTPSTPASSPLSSC